jgi:hypothetical protein
MQLISEAGETDSHSLAKKKRGRPPKVRVQPFHVSLPGTTSDIESLKERAMAESAEINDGDVAMIEEVK